MAPQRTLTVSLHSVHLRLPVHLSPVISRITQMTLLLLVVSMMEKEAKYIESTWTEDWIGNAVLRLFSRKYTNDFTS